MFLNQAVSASAIIGMIATTVMPAFAADFNVQRETGPTYWTQSVAAPSNAFELTLGTGYTQALGRLEEGRDMSELAKAGMSLDLGAGYRATPSFSFGVRGAYQFFNAGDGVAAEETSPASAVAAVVIGYHLMPFARLDPWLQLATGYRYLCRCDQPGLDERFHGLELVDAKLGLDVRVDRALALAPTIGGELSMFNWNRGSAMADPRVSGFVYAGIQARFDFGTHVERQQTAGP